MPIHDWTRVDAGIFHDFHTTWLVEIKRALNAGLLPPDHYAMAEQIAGGLGPDVLTLQRPANGTPDHPVLPTPSGGILLATAPPQVRFRTQPDSARYAAKAKRVAIRHTSDHRVVAVVELVSPGNKNSRDGLRSFVDKAGELLHNGVHLLIVDLFPPGPRDPQGIHRAIWENREDEFVFDPAKPLTCASYIGNPNLEAFIEPMAVGDAVPQMPLFLTPEVYIPVPLEATYQTAWEGVPAYWRGVVTGATS